MPAPRAKVLVGMPGSSLCFGAAQGLLAASLGRHEVQIMNSGNSWDNFNTLWAAALNAFEQGMFTHFAMIHTDVIPCPGWIDVLMDELDDRRADLCSAIIPIKDSRGATTTGIGDPADSWSPFRRFTVRELMTMPETFSAGDVGYEGWPLLHTSGLWVADLSREVFRQTDADGNLIAIFEFQRRIARRDDGKWEVACESEDWYFSRRLWELGANTIATRKVSLRHAGGVEYANDEPWGSYENGDDATRHKWGKFLVGRIGQEVVG